VITWEDPAEAVQTGKMISGIAYLKALLSGELPPPPIAVLLGMRITDVGEGRVVFAAEPAEYHYNPLGTVHGGVMATLLDSALGCAVQSMLPAGTSYTTLELKVNYLRPITAKTGTVYCEGKIIDVGGHTATAEGRSKYQPISRYEARPTSAQPTNRPTKLSESTSVSIANTKKFMYAKKRGKARSPDR
jgi:uncharacterized protein (TIGR00369 family)